MSYAEFGHRSDAAAVVPLSLPAERIQRGWSARLRCGLLGHETTLGIGGLVLPSPTCRRCGAPTAP